jgi:hypothetical protein
MVPNFEVISNKSSIDTTHTLSSSHEQNKITVLKVISVELGQWKRKAGFMSSAQNSLTLHGFPTVSFTCSFPNIECPTKNQLSNFLTLTQGSRILHLD